MSNKKVTKQADAEHVVSGQTLNELLLSEAQWCRENPDKAQRNQEWIDGFMAGMEHARCLAIAFDTYQYPTKQSVGVAKRKIAREGRKVNDDEQEMASDER